jgi:hypothetical protein
VARHAGPLMEEVHHPGTDTHLELRLDERIGHRRVVAVDFHVIINVDAGAFPLRICIGLGREGLQGGAVECLKKPESGAGQFLEGAGVERQQEGRDGRMAFSQSDEGVGPQPGHHPALDHVAPDCHCRFVSRRGGAGRDHSEAILVCEIGIRTIERGLIAVGAGDGGLEIVRDDEVGHPAQGGQGPHRGPNPVRQTLRPRGFDIGRVGGSPDGNTERRFMDFPGMAVHDGEALPSLVDKELFPGAMALAHDQGECAGPGTICLAEPAVRESLWCGGLLVLPHQEHRDALPFEFTGHWGPVGGRRCERAFGWRWWKQPLLQRGVIEPVRQWPRQARQLSARHVGRNGGAAQAKAPGNLPITEPDRPSDNFAVESAATLPWDQ